MSDEERIPAADYDRDVRYLSDQLIRVRRERDLYRDWFQRLFSEYQATLDQHGIRLETKAEAAYRDLAAKHAAVVNARTRGKVAKGKETRDRVLELQAAGKSITKTAEILGISASRVATIRTEAKRSK